MANHYYVTIVDNPAAAHAAYGAYVTYESDDYFAAGGGAPCNREYRAFDNLPDVANYLNQHNYDKDFLFSTISKSSISFTAECFSFPARFFHRNGQPVLLTKIFEYCPNIKTFMWNIECFIFVLYMPLWLVDILDNKIHAYNVKVPHDKSYDLYASLSDCQRAELIAQQEVSDKVVDFKQYC
jgi:hypothetical protein